jgi:hypothetical protein
MLLNMTSKYKTCIYLEVYFFFGKCKGNYYYIKKFILEGFLKYLRLQIAR